MLTGVRRSSAVLAALLVVGVVSTGIAAAEPPVGCARTNPRTGVCLLWSSTPGGGADTGAGPAAVGGGPSGGPAGVGGGTTPQSGAASSPDPCTYTVAQPQPPSTSALWQGQSPA